MYYDFIIACPQNGCNDIVHLNNAPKIKLIVETNHDFVPDFFEYSHFRVGFNPELIFSDIGI
jgi:hypothetical protein